MRTQARKPKCVETKCSWKSSLRKCGGQIPAEELSARPVQEEGIMGAKVQPGVRGAIVLWENDKQPTGAVWHRLWFSSAAVWEAAVGNFLVSASQIGFIWFNPSHHYKALIARFEILKETRCLHLCFHSVWSLTTVQVTPAQPAWSGQQRLSGQQFVLCGCALVRFPQWKSTSFPLNWDT